MSLHRRRVRNAEFADMVAEVKVVDLRERILRTSRRITTYRALSLMGLLALAIVALVTIHLI